MLAENPRRFFLFGRKVARERRRTRQSHLRGRFLIIIFNFYFFKTRPWPPAHGTEASGCSGDGRSSRCPCARSGRAEQRRTAPSTPRYKQTNKSILYRPLPRDGVHYCTNCDVMSIKNNHIHYYSPPHFNQWLLRCDIYLCNTRSGLCP